MTLERISAFITYCIAVLLAWLGDLSLKDASTVGGVLIGVLMLAINWYYRGRTSASVQPTSNGIQTKSTCEICQRTVSDPL
ncbi:hypothetical protein NQL45_001062 [Klebsiella aerogenes]